MSEPALGEKPNSRAADDDAPPTRYCRDDIAGFTVGNESHLVYSKFRRAAGKRRFSVRQARVRCATMLHVMKVRFPMTDMFDRPIKLYLTVPPGRCAR